MTMSRACRILLAEDNPGDVYLVREALNRQSLFYELLVATDGERAWTMIEAADAGKIEGFDICMLDLNLPVRPGLEVLTRIRSCRGPMAQALVVIVTSSNLTQDRVATSRDGADYYFCKPSNLHSFLQLGEIVSGLWAGRTLNSGNPTSIAQGAGGAQPNE
jgi:two-component system, chemotaxis family, response regulator Rcp1